VRRSEGASPSAVSALSRAPARPERRGGASAVALDDVEREVEQELKIVNDSLAVLDYMAKEKVLSQDADDKVPWAVLAALTETPRSTVKAYVVNARDGGDFLQAAITIYEIGRASCRERV